MLSKRAATGRFRPWVLRREAGAGIAGAIGGEGLDDARLHIHTNDAEADGSLDFADLGGHVAEFGDEGVTHMAKGSVAGEIQAIGGGVDAQNGGRLGRGVGVLGEDEFGHVVARRLEAAVVV